MEKSKCIIYKNCTLFSSIENILIKRQLVLATRVKLIWMKYYKNIEEDKNKEKKKDLNIVLKIYSNFASSFLYIYIYIPRLKNGNVCIRKYYKLWKSHGKMPAFYTVTRNYKIK